MNPVYPIFLDRTNGMEVGQNFQGYYEYSYNVNPKEFLKEALKPEK